MRTYELEMHDGGDGTDAEKIEAANDEAAIAIAKKLAQQ